MGDEFGVLVVKMERYPKLMGFYVGMEQYLLIPFLVG
jgi:hypothetical protein